MKSKGVVAVVLALGVLLSGCSNPIEELLGDVSKEIVVKEEGSSITTDSKLLVKASDLRESAMKEGEKGFVRYTMRILIKNSTEYPLQASAPTLNLYDETTGERYLFDFESWENKEVLTLDTGFEFTLNPSVELWGVYSVKLPTSFDPNHKLQWYTGVSMRSEQNGRVAITVSSDIEGGGGR